MQSIQISTECPPIYQRLKEKFGVDWDGGLIITYAPLVHCKKELSTAKIVHEATHLRQQGKNPAAWFDRYIDDTEFRLEQEVEAYREEASFVREKVKDRNLKYKMIFDMATMLSGPMYGNLLSHKMAMKLLK